MTLQIKIMNDKMLASIKLKTLNSCCKNGTNKERSALIRTSFGKLKASKCWLKSNYLIWNHRKRMRRLHTSWWEAQTVC